MSLMFTLVHVHLFSIVFYLRTLIGRLLALSGSGSLWVAMGGYGSLWVIPVFSTTEIQLQRTSPHSKHGLNQDDGQYVTTKPMETNALAHL